MLVMTLLVRDEEDILEHTIEFHLAQGVDMIIATDNLSTDGTPDILARYARLGVLRHLSESDDTYDQDLWVTRMARMAAVEFGADWVINGDADEFWWPGTGSLADVFASVPRAADFVRAVRSDFAYVAETSPAVPFHQRMVHRKSRSLNALGRPLPPKVAHRGDPAVVVHQGNHAVDGQDERRVADGLVEILHFPIRSRAQFERKIACGGAAYARNTRLAPEIGNTWRHLYEVLERDGHLECHLEPERYGPGRLEAGLADGSLVRDTRLADFLAGR